MAAGPHERSSRPAALHADAAYALAAAHALIKAGRAGEAVERARGMRQGDPRAGLAYTLESHALLGLGRPATRSNACGHAGRAPRDNDHHVALAVALQRCGRHEEAIRAFFDALALKMDDAVSHFRLGMSFKDLGMKAEAAECVRTAIVLGLGSSEVAARAQLAFLEREACRWSQADAVLRDLRDAVRALPPDTAWRPAPSRTPYWSTTRSSSSRSPATMRCTWRRCPGHCRAGPSARTAAACASATCRPTSTSTRPPADGADARVPRPQRVRGHAASTGPDDGSVMRRRIARQRALRGAARRSFESIAQRVRELGIDILVDLKGATYDTLLPVLAHRPAPLQVTWLGFPGTTGAPFIDYLIGDRVVTPLADAATSARRSRSCRTATSRTTRSGRGRSLDARRVGRSRGRAAAVRLSPVVQDLGEVIDSGAGCCTSCPVRCSGCCNGTPTWRPRSPRRRASAASARSGSCSRRCCRCSGT